MRIALVTDTYRPSVNGVATFTGNLAHALAVKGHEVLVLAPSSARAGFTEEDGVSEVGLPSVRLPFYGSARFCFDPRCSSALEAFVPDVVHLQTHFVLTRAALRWSRRTGVPSIATCHCRPENFLLNAPLKRGLLTRGLQASVGHIYWKDAVAVYSREDLVTTPVASVRELLRRRGLTSRVEVVPNGVDTDLFNDASDAGDEEVRAKYGIPRGKLLLFVGRLDGDKGVPELIALAGRLAAREEAHLVVCGSGTQETSFRRAIESLGLGRRVTITGTVAHRELASIYRLASALLVLNRNETQPLAVLEAFASGLPVVGLQSSNLEETVDDGVTGFLAESVEGVWEQARRLLDGDRLRLILGANARRTAVERYSLGAVADRFVECYESVADTRVFGRF